MKEYKMRRGETLEENAPDLKATIEEYFGPVTGTDEWNGNELYVVDEPDNPVFKRIVAGAAKYSGKKDQLAVHFEEHEAAAILEKGLEDHAQDAVSAKNEFLLEVTGRDAKSRRDSMKRAVEDDAPDY
ncbi:hypothetical protein C2R22_01770 [Salinigranum rubrum]|uniref:DUF5611 domain-containing protein n=1 Tax=Salinigranum rubrum TaxID=755307 RepID=A0A2I8VF34_9EURY|nr:DUF5611 family protein [Salinigranum rubrum]AUV80543.1 hypothetical protein C2R22_01770 [Salinigranum rubrum]